MLLINKSFNRPYGGHDLCGTATPKTLRQMHRSGLSPRRRQSLMSTCGFAKT